MITPTFESPFSITFRDVFSANSVKFFNLSTAQGLRIRPCAGSTTNFWGSRLNPLTGYSFLSYCPVWLDCLRALVIESLDVWEPPPHLSPRFVVSLGVPVVALEERHDVDRALWSERTLGAS